MTKIKIKATLEIELEVEDRSEFLKPYTKKGVLNKSDLANDFVKYEVENLVCEELQKHWRTIKVFNIDNLEVD